MSNWDMPKMTPENKPNGKVGIFEKLNTKSVGKFVAGATLFTVTMGEVGDVSESFGGEINNKTTIQQVKPNAEKSGLDFFDTSGRVQESIGSFPISTSEMPERLINKDTIIQKNVGTKNLNGESTQEQKETDRGNFFKIDESGNIQRRSIGNSK